MPSRAVSKETLASQDCSTDDAWKISPLRKDEVSIRRPGTALAASAVLFFSKIRCGNPKVPLASRVSRPHGFVVYRRCQRGPAALRPREDAPALWSPACGRRREASSRPPRDMPGAQRSRRASLRPAGQDRDLSTAPWRRTSSWVNQVFEAGHRWSPSGPSLPWAQPRSNLSRFPDNPDHDRLPALAISRKTMKGSLA